VVHALAAFFAQVASWRRPRSATYASTLDGLFRGYLREPGFGAIVQRDLADGQHRNPGDVPGWITTTTFFHVPDELLAEAADAGLYDVGVVAVEGPSPHLLLTRASQVLDTQRGRTPTSGMVERPALLATYRSVCGSR
jgi:hypothetical protein